jgi:murein DD-endopeptidase MepM/ murein hydrolase activator NlpD
MVRKPSHAHKQPRKPPISLLIFAVMIAVALSFSLIKNLFHKRKTNYANKTLSLPKLAIQKTEPDTAEDNGWKIITTHSGDSLASIFKRAGLSSQTLQAILHNNPHAKTLASIKPDQHIRLLIHDQVLEKLIIPISSTQHLIVSNKGKEYSSIIKSRKMDSHDDYITATIHGSLYGTAKRQNVSYKLIQQMTEIFNWEIDFAREVRTGDQFSILYKGYYIDDKLVSTGDIIAVTYTNRGVAHQAIRHGNAAGDFDYFTPQGVSLKKAFSRYPIKFSHISSTYSLSRYHPVLHYRRPHKGVDLAASIGTPIHATGDGRVEIIDRHNGYGNVIKISHSKIYSSLYAHLLRFQKGLARGDHVKRGQVIGYVGQTGLADGPHCHYEFHVNHQPKNPSTVELPRASPVPAREMASFKAKAGTLLSQLQLYENAHLAAAGKKPGAAG